MPVYVDDNELDAIFVYDGASDVEISERWVFDGTTDNLVFSAFQPVSMEWTAPGVYQFNVGKANRITVSARAGAGGGGGGGTSARPWPGQAGVGGVAGAGGLGMDGTAGAAGTRQRTVGNVQLISGSGGGGGEEGGPLTITTDGGVQILRLLGGRGGDGGDGSRILIGYRSGNIRVFSNSAAGGTGGGTRPNDFMGGAGGENERVFRANDFIGGSSQNGGLGESITSRTLEVTPGSTLTIVIGHGGRPGGGGDARAASNGAAGANGFLRLITSRV